MELSLATHPPPSLWLAIHLLRLPLEACAPLPSPSAIVAQGRILDSDDAAQRVGIAAGIGTAAARALAPTITLLARDAAREAAALQRLACWAGSLSPRISLTPDSLLLEIGGCLRLFGGLENVLAAAEAGARAQGFSAALAVAPTPLGAEWLAQGETAARCLDLATLRASLDALPTRLLPEKTSRLLTRFGVRRLAELRRLPSADLARRIGIDVVQALARAYGELPDPRVDFVFPEHFSQSLPLPAAVENAGALLFAARRLSAALAGWLTARQAGVRAMCLLLLHRQSRQSRQSTTPIHLLFAEATADAERFERVLRERLDQCLLAAPVESLQLDATDIAPLAGRNQALFGESNDGQDDIGVLLERLTARLGEDRVYRMISHDDYRPECATRRIGALAPGQGKVKRKAFSKTDSRQTPARPLWLLDPPETLAEVDGRPYRRGRLQLVSGPERIESGWWDGGERHDKTQGSASENGTPAAGDLRRDYFVALAADARYLWIYRECRAPGGWFLHGFFS